MKISGEYTFDAPQDIVWEALQDPTVLASVLPGCEKLEQTGENSYEGQLKIKVGPVQGKFQGNIELSNIEAPESYDIMIDGRGAPGFVKGGGGLKLKGQGEKTLMEYGGEAQVGGRIASVGQRLMDSSAKAIIRQSLEALNTTLKAKAEAAKAPAQAVSTNGSGQPRPQATPPPPVAPPAPPSQTEFALAVAKDVVDDLVPKQYQPMLFGAVLAFVAYMLYWLTAKSAARS